MRTKKKYGQHFLRSAVHSLEIANLIDNYDSISHVLEVGPGKGALTKSLLGKSKDLKCVEIDGEAVEYLMAENILEQSQIIHKSFLDLDLNSVFGGDEFILLGNFPYNISSQIVIRMLEYKGIIPVMIGMFQKEVADRLISPHGNKSYGQLSVITQRHYKGRLIMKLRPSDFSPPPKVDSAVILLEKKTNIPDLDEGRFRTIVKMAFSQRRKMLRNTLKQYLNDENAHWDVWTKRPEQLSVDDFENLVKELTT